MPIKGQNLRDLILSEGSRGFAVKLHRLLDEKKIDPGDISYRELAEACGVLDSLRAASSGDVSLLREDGAQGVSSALFPIVTSNLIHRHVIMGYENDEGWIGDRLVTVVPSTLRNQKIAGFKALAGPEEVAEGHPYPDSTFAEKYVTSKETKEGRILSINEELIQFDQTGEINRRAMMLGYYIRQEKERTQVRGAIDADGSTSGKEIYRPSGTGEALYATDGSNYNWVGSGNTTSSSYNSAVPLVDHTDIDEIRAYRATEIKDDRVDGTTRPIVSKANQLLVPESLRGTARRIANTTQLRNTTGETMLVPNPNPELEVLHSPFIDAEGGQAVNDWFLGDFPKQFVWTEIWPVQTFLQRSDGPLAFERDVVLRVKVRYYAGLSATDTVWVTKVDGAA